MREHLRLPKSRCHCSQKRGLHCLWTRQGRRRTHQFGTWTHQHRTRPLDLARGHINTARGPVDSAHGHKTTCGRAVSPAHGQVVTSAYGRTVTVTYGRAFPISHVLRHFLLGEVSGIRFWPSPFILWLSPFPVHVGRSVLCSFGAHRRTHVPGFDDQDENEQNAQLTPTQMHSKAIQNLYNQ